MTCNRFEAVKKNLHFNNNDNFKPRGTDGHDKLFKIRPVLDEIRERLLLVPKEEFLAVDEQIIPTKCRHEIKQYNPAKPHKWGFKNQVLSGVSGFSYDFDIFAGEQSDSFPSDAPNLGVSSNVVTRLTSTVLKHQNYKICFDNWFSSPNLQVYLFQNGLLPLGTVRLNRVPNSDMPTEKELKKNGRGSMVEKTAVIDNVKLSLVSWFDNKTVNMLSTYVASLLGTPTSSRANSTSRVNSPVMAKNFDTPKRRNATRTSLPDSPVPNKMARKTPARHQDLPLDSVRLAEDLRRPALAERARRYVLLHWGAAAEGDELLDLPLPLSTELMSSEAVTVECESEMLRAGLRWLDHEHEARAPHRLAVLRHVRLRLIPPDRLQQELKNFKDLHVAEVLDMVGEAPRTAVNKTIHATVGRTHDRLPPLRAPTSSGPDTPLGAGVGDAAARACAAAPEEHRPAVEAHVAGSGAGAVAGRRAATGEFRPAVETPSGSRRAVAIRRDDYTDTLFEHARSRETTSACVVPLDFSLWGLIKDLVFAKDSSSVLQMHQRIEDVFAKLKRDLETCSAVEQSS
ncbi:PiggyBac transposable element-derived protein 3 [Eumeta japonica]|uniref:PiggyBac transposable element-derived protein 3 n=1 Tax=Eumeta variegata TaxID=151549 RepID=A0A4C1YDF2_EUMVA|nr:PiggyBac transposable element-derived protein 3 [Eumeta japonica]